MRLAVKIAAVLVLACCGVVTYLRLRASPEAPRNVVVIPPPVPPRPTVPDPDQDPAPRRQVETPKSAPLAAGVASITGTVKFAGEAPERQQIAMSVMPECAVQHPEGAFDESVVVMNGLLANVVVWVEPDDVRALPAADLPLTPAVLDQKGCQYRPHVLAMRAGQALVVSNGDPFLHNVHALSIDNPAFNFGQPTKNPGTNAAVMKVPEVFKVKCDVHPWMSAYVHVIDHPYFAVTREDGRFAIPAGLPDGTYTLVAWHEKLGEQRRQARVAGGKAEGADFAFSAE